MKVKICGITSLEDAQVAATAGAWGIGFIFYPKSPRYIAPEKAARISAALPAALERVGVFVNERPVEIERVAKQAGLTRIQLHGDESPEACASLSLPVIKVFRDSGTPALKAFASSCSIFLVDARVPDGVWGGVGMQADREFAGSFRARRDREAPGVEVFLAGGITPENAAQAIREVRPDGIDVSSGVEDRPGVKNHERIRALLRAVRSS